jgi:cell division protein FtsB
MKNFSASLNLSKKNLGILLLIFAGVNIFGPKGLFRLLVMKQEILRMETATAELKKEITGLERDLADFKQSALTKERAIRSELGLLLENEWSVEFPVAIHDQ